MADIQIMRKSASSVGTPDLLTEIENHVLDAVNELVRRASGDNPAQPEILDRKSPSNDVFESKGVVQDCEFGLMVLMAEDWLSRRNSARGEIADGENVRILITSLVKRTVEHVTMLRNNSFARGRLESSLVFFSGAPYTYYRNERKKEAFSANLDAAMLIIAFLTAALEKFDESLNETTFTISEGFKQRGVTTLRDATLLVCSEGLRYATECRVVRDKVFIGYTCDPESNKDPHASLDDHDRLFFSWTTCETVNELLNWRTAYLDKVDSKSSANTIAAEMRTFLDILSSDLEATSRWCLDRFLPSFNQVLPNAPPIGRTVVEAGKYKSEESLSDELQAVCAEIGKFVQHAYHISQYAAIRSIEPVEIKVDEIRQILLTLDTLVSQYVLSTGLDTAGHEDLFRTLTRYYSLGVTASVTYRDDAYFPLVVRSLSGLLSRTIDIFRPLDSEVRDLVKSFRLSLQNRYQNLIMRQAEVEQPGDEKLWSFATGKPFVLYATQRTIFALIEYMKFLLKMHEVESERDDEEKERKAKPSDLRTVISNRLAEVLIGPAIDSFLKEYPSFSLLSAQPQVDLTGNYLPQPDWARQVMLDWLESVKSDFEGKGVQKAMEQYALQTVLILTEWTELDPGKLVTKDPRDKSKKFAECVEGLFGIPAIGPKLSDMAERRSWGDEDLQQILFRHIFQEFVSNGGSLSDLLTGKTGLSGHIKSAHKYAMDLRKD